MQKLLLALVLTFALAAAGADARGKAPAQGYTRDAQRILAQARLASGGHGWDYLRGWHETGHLGALAYERWLDPLRYGARVETAEAAGRHIHGFNGGGDWHIQPSGLITGVDDPPTVARARTEAFFASSGYFYPGRFDAHGEALATRKANGQTFDVVLVQPWAGWPRELWFDHRTHLLARLVDRTGPKPVTTMLSDYRKVGPLQIAFRQTPDDGGPVRQLDSIAFPPTDRTMFSLPKLTP